LVRDVEVEVELLNEVADEVDAVLVTLLLLPEEVDDPEVVADDEALADPPVNANSSL
jgi:hypothetical protein